MKIVPNIIYPQIGNVIEFQKDGQQYIIDREGIDNAWILRGKSKNTCAIYKELLISGILKHQVKILKHQVKIIK